MDCEEGTGLIRRAYGRPLHAVWRSGAAASVLPALLCLMPQAVLALPSCQTPITTPGGQVSAQLANCPPEPPAPPAPPLRNAQFVGQSVPTAMVVGQTYPVSVTMKNTGTATWTAAAYRLGSQNPGDNLTWGLQRVDVAGSVANGQTTPFNFTARAPAAAGTYNFQWKMLQEGQAWFGAVSTNQTVTVYASAITGNIEGISGGNIIGWACSTRLDAPISVHLYLGGPAGVGAGVSAHWANLASEPAVASACQANGTTYRFSLPITPQLVSQYGGQTIHVHGISPVGASNLTIANSGTYRIPANQSPAITLTAPVNGSSFNAPASMTLKATASDPDDGVGKVVFYANGQEIHTATAAPYEFTTSSLAAGNYQFKAVVTDTRGATAESSVSTVAAIQPPWTPPLIPPGYSVKRRYVYDQYQQLCKTIEPETGATVMDYDNAGNLQWSAAGVDLPSTTSCDTIAGRDSGRKVTRYYDARNRITNLVFPDGIGNQAWAYTPDGLPSRIHTENGPGGAAVFNDYVYNKRRLLTGESVTQPGWYGWGIGYGYDANGNLSTQTYPTGLVIHYAPNALGQPTQAGSYASGVQYYPNGAIKQFTYGNGLVHSMGQNARQLPARSTDSGGAADFAYTYDQNANVTSIWDHARDSGNGLYGRWMAYDGLDRLTDAGSCSFGGDCWHRFTYDALDNIASWKLPGVKDYASYYYDPNTNRLANIQNSAGASVVGLSYDVQGNLANKNGKTYTFDFGNRLRGTNEEWYRYDGHGRRVLNWRATEAGVLSQYSQSGQLLYDENHRASGRKATEYVYLSGSLLVSRERNIDNNVYDNKYQHTDALGSPVAVTNQAGQVIDRTSYDPYGGAINKTVDGIGYTGHVMDAATGLTYMQQRYYDPMLGRFLSVDPVTANSGTGANFNRYWYANNNPYKFTDPDGRLGRGTGWKDQDWNKFNRAQQRAATNLDKSAAKITNALATGKGLNSITKSFEKNFGQGSGTAANMASVAGDMSKMAGALHDTSANAIPANAMTSQQLSAAYPGVGAGTLAGVPTSGPTQVIVNVSHPGFNSSSTLSWGAGHETGHAVLGYKDQMLNGFKAYKFGGPDEQNSFQNLPGAQRLNNPDHLMDFAQ